VRATQRGLWEVRLLRAVYQCRYLPACLPACLSVVPACLPACLTKSSFHRPNLWQHTSASPRAPVLTRPAAREQPVESWWYPGPAREARSRSAASCKIAGSCSTSLSSSLRAPTATGVGVSPRRVREPRVLFVFGAPRRFANHQWASGKPTQPLVGAARPSGPPHPGQSTPIIAIGRGAVVIVVGD